MLSYNLTDDERIVTDYDFVFVNGVPIGVTIDKVAGDSIDFQADKVIITIAGRPLPSNPKVLSAVETTTIFQANLMLVNSRTRTLLPTTVEQKIEFQELLKKATTTKTVH